MKAALTSPRRTIDLRSINRQTALRWLYFEGPMSRLELSQRTGLSVATVTNLVTELLKEEIVIEIGQVESEGGRPRTLMTVNPQYGCFVGVDVGETHIQLELFDLALRKQNTVRYLLPAQDNAPQTYVDYIAAGLQELVAAQTTARAMILGVGIGLPGMVERNGGHMVSSPIWKWQNVAFGDLLTAKIDRPIYLDNGAKAMTLAESWFGAGRGYDNLITVLIGTGIGSGIITGGSLYRGPTNSAGEFGHTLVVLDGRACRCGSFGCLETYAGAPGIIATLRELAPGSPLLDANQRANNQLAVLNSIVQAAAAGDSAALKTLRITAHYLGAAIANLVNLFNPEKIVVGGWAGLEIGDFILDDLRAHVNRYALPLSRTAVQIDLCHLGQDAICMGAACLILDEFLSANARFLRHEKA
ncbi:MAG: ROK family protein [Chloroflexi bacterium]|nr:ROK family protein [Chloroflexota bacterium]